MRTRQPEHSGCPSEKSNPYRIIVKFEIKIGHKSKI